MALHVSKFNHLRIYISSCKLGIHTGLERILTWSRLFFLVGVFVVGDGDGDGDGKANN